MKRLLEVDEREVWLPRDIVQTLLLHTFGFDLHNLKRYNALLALRLVSREWSAAVNAGLLRQVRITDGEVISFVLFGSAPSLFGVSDASDVGATIVDLFRACERLLIVHHRIVQWLVDGVPRMPALRALWINTTGGWPVEWNSALPHIKHLCISHMHAQHGAGPITLAGLDVLWVLSPWHRYHVPALKHYAGPLDKTLFASATSYVYLPSWKVSVAVHRCARRAFLAGAVMFSPVL